jgi:hypothetical protein
VPIEIHEVEITNDPAPTRGAAPAASPTPVTATQSTQRRILAARLLDRELSSRASRLRAD